MATTIAATAANTGAAAQTGTKASATLAGNFNDFLKLLMTQLKNQDPTAPMDTNQFTQQLVQFTSVEQQINTNSSLTKLIEATQGNTLLQSSGLVGKTVTVATDQLSLQSGQGSIRFAAPTTGPVAVGVYTEAGTKLQDASLPAGATGWTWNGKGANGQTLPDGAYKVVATSADGTAQPFTVQAQATGVQRVNDGMKVALGGLKVDFSAVQSVGN